MLSLRSIHKQMKDGEVQLVAASLSYSTVLSIVPFLAVVLAALNSVGGSEALYPKVEKLLLMNFQDTLGSEGVIYLKKIIKRVLSGKFGTLGAIFLILTSTRLIYDMERGIHRVWNIKNSRPLSQRLLIYWVILLSLPVILAIFVKLKSSSTVAELTLPLPSAGKTAIGLFFMIWMVNKLVPNIKVGWFSSLIGSLVTTGLLLVLQMSFSTLAKSVFQYSKLYGGIAAIPAFLIWILLFWQFVLFGVSVTASLNKTGLIHPRVI